jgi:hypothetical protein
MILPVPTKRATFSLVNVKSCNEMLFMLLVCISIYLVSVLRYTFLILGTCYPLLYLREQECENAWLFFETKRVGEHISLGTTALNNSVSSLFAVGSKFVDTLYFGNVTLKCTRCRYMCLNLVELYC